MSDDEVTHPDHPLQVEWRAWVRPYMQQSTAELRSSPMRRWEQLRDHLTIVGVPLAKAVVADLHEEDGHLEFGIVAAADGRGFLFEFRYDADADGKPLTRPDQEAWVSRWEKLDDRGLWAHRRELDVARSLLAEEPPEEGRG